MLGRVTKAPAATHRKSSLNSEPLKVVIHCILLNPSSDSYPIGRYNVSCYAELPVKRTQPLEEEMSPDRRNITSRSVMQISQ